ncbi:cysteine-rich protein 2-binding protein isoform X1 [Centruroides vittatus]|uniref:cysteine-rich protein 2-binding protein isoform X1 n=1 Tax=Centruroides vittatus TaxID=120091 RepID=UPI00350F1493
MSMNQSTLSGHCYCGALEAEQYMLDCQKCRKLFHLGCLISGRPSNIMGDTYFNFTCSLCSPTGNEVVERSRLLWIHAILLTLYNLQLKGGGKCGFYRWREHICNFIDRNWTTFFGNTRTKKKTSTWHGTVAGTLSANCPQLFRSGSSVLKENGWWALADSSLPTPTELEILLANQKIGRKNKCSVQEVSPKVEGLRHRSTKTAIQAAMELKERRSVLQEAKEIRKTKQLFSCQDNDIPSLNVNETEERKMDDCKIETLDSYSGAISKNDSNFNLDFNIMQDESISDLNNEIHISGKNIIEKSTEQKLIFNKERTIEEAIQENLFKDNDIPSTKEETVEGNVLTDFSYLLQTDENDDFDIDPTSISSPLLHHPELPAVEDLLSTFSCSDEKTISLTEGVDIKEEPESDEDKQLDEPDDQIFESDEEVVTNNHPCASTVPEVGRKRKAVFKEEPTNVSKPSKTKCELMTIYDEQLLLKKLDAMYDTIQKCPTARRLRRKLIIRKLKREKNLPIFNLDTEVQLHCGLIQQENVEKPVFKCLPSVQSKPGSHILDRYQTGHYIVCGTSHHHPNFVTRLMGFEEDQECIISPYTARILKPYIFRDYETTPLKLKLMNEIIAHYHRYDKDWKPLQQHPIDYCYVRPQHIAVVNSLCREYFWPGIDLSECLQYPDFSCVALYRKVVIGFAFMVPDVKYNEAYISFIFTHPEWRNAGIATFMLYHLIQTCMGKDVTLHVSATNPALFLYQKFGFKVEEFILDFYEKYFPPNTKECRHAMFLRLSR